MSSIDERVVQMRFDNGQFEGGIRDSVKSLDNLKKSLNLEGAARGLNEIDRAGRSLSLAGMASNVDSIASRFTNLGIVGVTALTNIANSALETGKNLLSSLTIDPITTGFEEYETKMGSIQTILTNTASKGTTLDDVNKALDELNTYSDQTIYNFAEMTKNIGTFTAAGVDLNTSTMAIKGIANLAAGSGSSALQASTAMYQLSQAIAAGKVSLMDWNSVINAGMGGELFQKALEKTATELGHGRDMAVSFRESLDAKKGDGWLTSDVLLKTLQKFADDPALVKAATEVKTFTQLLSTMRESVQSGWAKTWELIIGGKNESTTLLTGISGVFSAIVGQSDKARNEVVKGWKDLGGRTALIESFKNAFDSIMGIAGSLNGAFRDIFPATTAKQLVALTQGLQTLTANLKMSEFDLNNLRSTFKGVFAVLDIGKTIFLGLFNAVGVMLGGVGNLASTILTVTGAFGEWLTALDNTIKSSGIINKALLSIGYGINNVFTDIGGVLNYLGAKFIEIRTAVLKQIKFDPWVSFSNMLTNIGKVVTYLSEKLSELQTKISNMFTGVAQSFDGIDIGGAIQKMYNGVSKALVGSNDQVKKANDQVQSSFTTSIDNFIKNIGRISMAGIGLAIAKMVMTFTEMIRKKGDINSIFDGLKEAISGGLGQITSTLDSVRSCLKSYQDQLKAGLLIKIATAIAILAAAIVAVSLVDSAKLASSLAAIGGLFAQLLIAMKLFTLIGEMKASAIKASVVMITMSTSILIMAHAMQILGKLDVTQTITALGSVLALMAMMAMVTKVLSKDSGTFVKGALSIIAFAEAIKILAQACTSLSNLNPEQLKKGLIGIGVLLAELSLFLNKTNASLGLKTAAGILILSVALNNMYYAVKNIGDLNWETIKKGLMGIGGVLAEVATFDKFTSSSKNVIATSISLGIISVAMNNMGTVLSKIGELNWEVIKKGFLGIGGVLLEVAAFDKFTSSSKNVIATSASLVIVAYALQKMYTPLSQIGALNWEDIKKGLLGMGLALLEIFAFNKLSSGVKGTITTTIGLGITVGALALLAKDLQAFGGMNWEDIKKGLIGMGLAMLEILIMMNSLSKYTPVNAIALLEICTALNILTKAFQSFATLSWEGIAKGIVAVGLALGVISLSMQKLPADSIFTALGLTGVASAMVVMTQALIPLSNLSWEGIIKGIVGIGGSLVVLAGGIKLMEGSLTGILTLILAATALNLLVPPILQLSAISWEGMLKSLLTLAGVFVVLGLAAAVLAPVVPAMFALSGALVVLGLAVVAIGAGVALAAYGFDKLTASFAKLDGTTQQGAANISSAMAAMVKGIGDGIPALAKKMGEGMVAMVQSIANNIPAFANGIFKIISGMLDVLTKWAPVIAQKMLNIVLLMLNVVAQNVPRFVTAAADIIVAFINGISDNLPRIIDSAFKLIIAFINGLADAINGNSAALNDACVKLVDAIVNSIADLGGKFVDAGVNAVKGFIKGLKSDAGSLIDAGASLGKLALQAAKDSLNIKSPSRVFRDEVGAMVAAGMASGIRLHAKEAADASEEMAKDAVDTAKAWIEDRKFYNQISLDEELYVWEQIQDKYAQGTEERVKADKEAYTIKNEIYKRDYDNACKWIDDQKYYNKLSIEDELKTWKNMQSQYAAGTAEREKIDREVYRVQNEVNQKKKESDQEVFDAAVKLMEDRKYYNKLSLAEELAAWQDLQKKYAEGTAEREKADREAYRVQKEMNDKRKSIEDDYQSKVKSVNEKLKTDIKSLNDAYDQALKSKTDSLYNAYGLFDKIQAQKPVSGKQLTANLKGQITEFQDWQKNLDELSGKGISSDLMVELRNMGEKSMMQVKALNQMTQPELDEYVSLWKTKHSEAADQAVSELTTLKTETAVKIQELRDQASKDLSALRQEWANQMAQLNATSDEQLTTLNTTYDTQVNNLADGTKQKMVDLSNNIKNIDWTSVGMAIVDGMIKGIKQKAAELAQIAAETALAALQAAKDALGIASPSKEFAKLGMYSDIGFANGLEKFAGVVTTSASGIGNSAIDALKSSISNISDIVNGSVDTSPVIRPVLDLSDIKSGGLLVDKMFAKTQGINVSSIANRIPNISTGQQATSGVSQVGDKGTSITFTQNNYSPTALSRLDIYRQTRNQISTMKGLVSD